jgi:hypothetical protein
MVLVTVEELARDLRALGLQQGPTVLAHISLSGIGSVIGGEQAVIEALLDVLGESGTLVMPAQSWQLCDPAYLNDPGIPREAWPVLRAHLPAYDPAVTPTRTMVPGRNCSAPSQVQSAAAAPIARSQPAGREPRRSPRSTTSIAPTVSGPPQGDVRPGCQHPAARCGPRQEHDPAPGLLVHSVSCPSGSNWLAVHRLMLLGPHQSWPAFLGRLFVLTCRGAGPASGRAWGRPVEEVGQRVGQPGGCDVGGVVGGAGDLQGSGVRQRLGQQVGSVLEVLRTA